MTTYNNITVKTLDDAGLNAAAIALNNFVFADFTPNIVIGIRTGGFVVAEAMVKNMANSSQLLAISKQRSSTQKKSMLKNILRLLPYFISDKLRIIEHKLLNSKPAVAGEPFTPNESEFTALKNALLIGENHKILIVDDAVDSGATMLAVADLVKAQAGVNSMVKTAAITVTTTAPLIQPDYKLYNLVLCRFSWSFDFKK